MREIKFRYYDSTIKQFIYSDEFSYPGICERLEMFFGKARNYSEDVIQQFTGLKDKNGQDIYEGDILKEHHYEDWGDEEGFEYVGVVRHRSYSNDAGNQFSGFVTYPNLRENKGYAGTPIKVDCEVIGNIFENTDLLK